MPPAAYTQAFWAKSDRENPQRIHLLEHHMADVGACFEALLAQPTIRQRLAQAGKLKDIDPVTAARLAVLAAVHDIGKVNIGFQTRIWQESDFPTDTRYPRSAGHIADLIPVLSGEDDVTAKWFFDALGWWWDATESWDNCDGETVCGLFVAALSHHGRPLNLEEPRFKNARIWRSFGALHPRHGVERIGRLVRNWFPAAWSANGPPLPSAPTFQHMFLGLCMLADWIGSDETHFPFCAEPRDDYMQTARHNAHNALLEIGLNIEGQRNAFHALPALPSFDTLFGIPNATPNPIQQAAIAVPLDERLVIIESETGSGKTEAALWRFSHLYRARRVDGLYFALPTRAAASQMHGRITRFIAKLFPEGVGPEPVLAVPGYVRAGAATGKHLSNYRVWWDDHPDILTDSRRWAAESAKRYLAAQIAVGTVDQAMLAALQVKHAHMRAACLSRNLLVVDEVHASDPYMRVILEALLRVHIGAGGYALLMSATLGCAARARWLSEKSSSAANTPPSLNDAIGTPYPAVSTRTGKTTIAVNGNGREKTARVEALSDMGDFTQVAQRALHAARAGAKVLVVRNTVQYAIDTQQTVEATATPDERDLLYTCHDTLTLHHGRFAREDRLVLDRAVEEHLGKDRPPGGRIIVGTQTLEQSLDIDADLLITDLCPMDVLLQRIGRLHRHQRDDRPAGYDTPACIVLMPEGNDLSPLLSKGPGRNGLGPHGFVYEDLRVLEATRRLILHHPEWRIPAMNRELVERTTHPDALKAITDELGDAWQIHATRMIGATLAGALTARSALVQYDKSFFGEDNRDVVFGSEEERIRTRLGDEGVEVELDPPAPGPFGAEDITRLTIPHHLAPRLTGAATEDEPVAPTLEEDGFTFRIGESRFRYDRLGLRRV